MSFIFRQNSSHAPTSWSSKFHIDRMKKESFKKSYYEPTPEYQLLKMLLAYPVKHEEFFYMSINNYVSTLVAVTRDVMEKDYSKVVEFTLLARKHGLVKDPPLIVSQLFKSSHDIAKLLKEYPVTKDLLYVQVARRLRTTFGWTYGHMKKKALELTLNTHDIRWHELQIMKYRRKYAKLLKLIHPRPENDEISRIWGYVVGKNEPPTPRLEVIDAIKKCLNNKDCQKLFQLSKSKDVIDAIFELAIQYDLSWELLRNRLGVKPFSKEQLLELAEKTWSPYDLTAQFSSLASKVGIDNAIKILLKRKHTIPLSTLYRMIEGIITSPRYPSEYKEAIIKLEEKIGKEKQYEIMNLLKNSLEKGLDTEKIIALIDVSGSMSGSRITSVIRILSPIWRLIDKYYIFNEDIGTKEYDVEEYMDIIRLTDYPDSGTPLLDSIKEVSTIAKKENALLLVFTDEQENVSTTPTEEIRDILKDLPTIVINPLPYPTSFLLPDEPLPTLIGLVGSDINAVIGSVRILQINKIKTTKQLVTPEDLEKYLFPLL